MALRMNPNCIVLLLLGIIDQLMESTLVYTEFQLVFLCGDVMIDRTWENYPRCTPRKKEENRYEAVSL